MRQGNLVRLAGIIVLIAFAAWVDWPANTGVHLGPLSLTPRVVEGLDLRGGVRVLLEADLPETTQISAEQMQVVREILEKRVNSLGVTEPLVQVAGQRRVLVEIPGIEDPDQAIATIRQTGLLEFVEVDAAGRAALLSGQIPVLTDLEIGASPSLPTELPPSTSPSMPTVEAAGSGTTPTPTTPTGCTTSTVFHTVMTGTGCPARPPRLWTACRDIEFCHGQARISRPR
jgi:preprotein translocase subunit SecD